MTIDVETVDGWCALAHLSQATREVLRLHWTEGRSYSEIAAALGIPEPTVRQRVSRAVRRIRTADSETARRRRETLARITPGELADVIWDELHPQPSNPGPSLIGRVYEYRGIVGAESGAIRAQPLTREDVGRICLAAELGRILRS